MHWRPRLESSLRLELCQGKIIVQGKVDLALGQAQGTQARVLIVDLKTGQPAAAHADDLRLYALLETLRVGVPPFRMASYYLDSGTWHAEDVDEGVLVAAVRRLVDGAAKVVELRFEGRAPTIVPGPACRYCPARNDCQGAKVWAERRRRIAEEVDGEHGDDADDEFDDAGLNETGDARDGGALGRDVALSPAGDPTRSGG
jgi:hypothetical protein